MSLIERNYLKAFLEQEGLGALKRLSQNFLVCSKTLKSILKSARLDQSVGVLEIGPGPGVLTESILAEGVPVTAIELDRGFSKSLRQRFGEKLHLVEGDALKVDFRALQQEAPFDRVVANLPYAITGPLLGKCLEVPGLFRQITVMVQWENAQRMIACPGEENFSLLSLLITAYGTAEIVTRVPASAFYPAPRVDSAVVTIHLREEIDSKTAPALSLARKAFQQRRKMIRSSLSSLSLCSLSLDEVFQQVGLTGEERPETLQWSQWLALVEALEV